MFPLVMKKNILIYLAILLSLGFAGASVGLILKTKTNLFKQPVSNSGPSLAILGPKSSQTKKDQIAKEVLLCMDEQLKNSKGIYHNNLLCNRKSQCKPVESNRSSTQPIWAKFQYVKRHHSEAMLQSLLVDAEKAEEHINTIQNVFWNCKFAVDMYEDAHKLKTSDLISDKDERNLVFNLCFKRNVYYYSQIPEEHQQEVPDTPYQPNLNTFETNLNKEDYRAKYVLDRSQTDLVTFLPSEYLARYRLSHKINDLKRANFFFHQSLELIKDNSTELKPKDICMIGQASLDYYQLFETDYYLQLAKTIHNNFTQIQPTNLSHKNLMDKAVCAYFTHNIAQATNEPSFEAKRQTFIQDLLTNHLEENKSSKKGRCFVSDLSTQREKPIYANSLIVDLLLESQNE